MQCKSCLTDIDPKWKHAIEKNICPFCGGDILDEHLKNLLTTLSETMEQLKQYQTQVNDWMLSNYSYIKTDDPNLISYLPEDILANLKSPVKKKVSQEKEFKEIKLPDGTTTTVEIEKLVDDEKASEFMKRAKDDIKLIDKEKKLEFKSVQSKAQYLKKMAQQIKNGETDTSYIKEADLNNMISSEHNQQEMEEAIDYQDMINNSQAINSSLNSQDMSQEDDDSPVPNFILNRMANNTTKATKKTPQDDLKALEQQREKSQGLTGNGSFYRG